MRVRCELPVKDEPCALTTRLGEVHEGPCMTLEDFRRAERGVRCTKFAGYATGEVYECRREAGHDGPCAADLVRGSARDIGRGEYEDRCSATAYTAISPADGMDTLAEVRCTLAADHEEDHRAAFEWPGTGQR